MVSRTTWSTGHENRYYISKNYKRAVKNGKPEKSALCKHLMLFDHCINWKSSTVLKYVNSYCRRLIAESWFINAHLNVINCSDGETLPSVYQSLAKSAR